MNDKQEQVLEGLEPDAIVYISKTVEAWGEEKGEDLSWEEADLLADAVGLSDEEFKERFDGTPGSFLLNPKAMRRHYL